MKTTQEQNKIDLGKLIERIEDNQRILKSASDYSKLELYELVLEEIKYELISINK